MQFFINKRSLFYQIMKAYLILMSFSLLFSLQSQAVRIGKLFHYEETDLNDATVNNRTHWEEIRNRFEEEDFVEIIFENHILSELGLREFLKFNLDQVISLQFVNIVMNKKMMDILVTSQLFFQLQVFYFHNCNIRDEDLELIEEVESPLVILAITGK